MKWSVIGLIAVGFVAAFCAAVIVSYMLATGNGQQIETDGFFIEATRDIERGTVISADDINKKKVPKENIPENSYSESAQVIGKVLVMGMKKGQAFTKSCFPSEGEGLQVAGRLAPGMRAVSLTVDESSGLRGILYPGCDVDILVSLKSASGKGTISKVLVEGVQVLAVDAKTLFTPKAKETEVKDEKKKMMVTVLVTIAQARELHLATKYGTLSLALRNPMDVQHGTKDMTSLGTLLGKSNRDKVLTTSTLPAGEAASDFLGEEEDVEGSPEKPKWKITIIQGSKTEDKEFDYSENKIQKKP